MANTSTLVAEHGSNVLSNIDVSAFHGVGADHSLLALDDAGTNVHYFAQEIEAEYQSAGITFDDLADSNAQNIFRKIGFLILAAQLFTVIFKGLGSHGNIAMAYGAGGGVATRLVCTICAVFMLTDIRVIPPIVDMLQEGVVWIGNWIFSNVSEDANSDYSFTY